MSAAATAAGYLYASGRLRGRAGKEGQDASPGERANAPAQQQPAPRKRPVRVAAIAEAPADPRAPSVARDKPAPKIQYRTRRWRPDF